jgi:hypothetical protein
MSGERLHTHHIPEHPGVGRLGRHVRHDPRSLAYQHPAKSLGDLKSARHQRYIPVLDQGELGSCTGNAALGAVGTGTLFTALDKNTLQPSTTDADGNEQRAVALYSAATKLDDVWGTYPPDDTGSSGLAVAKAAQKAGLISGYTHATSLEAMLTALETQAVITGVSWYDSFDSPASDGLIRIARGASVRGGHEFVLDEIDVENHLVWLTNSWSESWGLEGRACLPWGDFEQLLDEDGDVTVFTPITAPAPQPQPPPGGDTELAGCLSILIPLAQRWLGRRKKAS